MTWSTANLHQSLTFKGSQLLGVTPADCLVFEDTPAGAEAARRAGMKAIALTTTYPATEFSKADGVVGTLADVKLKISGNVLEVGGFAGKI